jgi:hypothetical protein
MEVENVFCIRIGRNCQLSLILIIMKLSLPDIAKVRLMLWGSFGSVAYYAIGGKPANVCSVGNELSRS